MTTTNEDIFTLHSHGYICVIPVNCYGVAGAGLAKAWKKRDPAAYKRYKAMCYERALWPGCLAYLSGGWRLAATKNHWKNPSEEAWIVSILQDIQWLSEAYPERKIAVPLLGCGCGGLSKEWFLEEAQRILKDCGNVVVCVR